jgi:hypothetical protein
VKSLPFDSLPLWAVYLVTLILILAAMGGGYWYVKAKHRMTPPAPNAQLSAIAAATLGLLAFLMAFVLGFGVNVAQERRALVVADANAIRTSYLRAGYLDEPYRSEARSLLRESLDLRVAALDPAKVEAAVARTNEIYGQLWATTEDVVRAGNTSAVTALYVGSVNELMDQYAKRVNMGLYVRTPPLILLFLYLITLATAFLVGMQVGYGKSRSLIAPVLLAVVLSAVLYLIFDLDRAQQGLLQVPQQAIYDLQNQIGNMP